MITVKKLMLTGAALMFFKMFLSAQDGRKALPNRGTQTNNEACHSCDSLADAYLFAGDTSMAIFYYQKYIDAQPKESAKQNDAVTKLRRAYYHRNRAFYLTDY